MTFDDLQSLCEEAARDLAAREGRPLPAAVVLPTPQATSVTSLPDFPDDDVERFDLLSHFAAERMRPAGIPCYGFVAEAELGKDAGDPEGPTDVVMVVFGARRHRPRVIAAPIAEGEVGPFSPPEDLDPTAMPFLSPLQHAADAAEAGDPVGGIIG